MANYAWDGTAGDNLWSTVGNWTPEPAAGDWPCKAPNVDIVTINTPTASPIQIDQNITLPATSTITQSTAASAVTINAGVTVTISAGTWSISSTGAGSSINISGTLIVGNSATAANFFIDASNTTLTINDGGQLQVGGAGGTVNAYGSVTTDTSNKTIAVSGLGPSSSGAIWVKAGLCSLIGRSTNGTVTINTGASVVCDGGTLNLYGAGTYTCVNNKIQVNAAIITLNNAAAFNCFSNINGSTVFYADDISSYRTVIFDGTSITTNGTSIYRMWHRASTLTFYGYSLTYKNVSITVNTGTFFSLFGGDVSTSTIAASGPITCLLTSTTGTTIDCKGSFNVAYYGNYLNCTIEGANTVINCLGGATSTYLIIGNQVDTTSLTVSSGVTINVGNTSLGGIFCVSNALTPTYNAGITLNGLIQCVNPGAASSIQIMLSSSTTLVFGCTIGTTGRIYACGTNATVKIGNNTNPMSRITVNNDGTANTGIEVEAGATLVMDIKNIEFSGTTGLKIMGNQIPVVNQQNSLKSPQADVELANSMGTLLTSSRNLIQKHVV